jgi:hypothetical protein
MQSGVSRVDTRVSSGRRFKLGTGKKIDGRKGWDGGSLENINLEVEILLERSW